MYVMMKVAAEVVADLVDGAVDNCQEETTRVVPHKSPGAIVFALVPTCNVAFFLTAILVAWAWAWAWA